MPGANADRRVAIVARLGILPAHRRARWRASAAPARFSGRAAAMPVEVRAGGVEFVPALQDRRAQHQHGASARQDPSTTSRAPPARSRENAGRLRRATRGCRPWQAPSPAPDRSALAPRRRLQRLQLAELRCAPAGKALQHLRIVGGHVRRRRRQCSERQRRLRPRSGATSRRGGKTARESLPGRESMLLHSDPLTAPAGRTDWRRASRRNRCAAGSCRHTASAGTGSSSRCPSP